MAKQDKKSVVVYADWLKKFEALEDGEAGRLIKHFFRYVNDLNPVAPDRITEISFIDIEASLKRDLVKWEIRAERSRENGKSGGRPIVHEKPKETQQVILEPTKPDSVTVNDTVNVNANVTVNDIKEKKSKDERSALFTQKCINENNLHKILDEYNLNEFTKYWTETSEKQKKIRCEFETVFDVKRRLETWKSNNFKFNKNDTNSRNNPKTTTNSATILKPGKPFGEL